MLKGVGEDYDTTFIHNNLIEGVLPKFSSKEGKQQIVVSKTMADKLNLHAGDRIFAYFLGDNNIRTRRFTITGIYLSNLKKFDEVLCFTDFHTAQKLNGYDDDMATGAEITVKDFSELDLVADEFIDNINRKQDREGNVYASLTIKESYSQIFSWLDLLDLNVWIILVLMICVAGFTMISGLLIIILERTSMIGILKRPGRTQQDDTPHIPLVCRVHHRPGNAMGQRHRYRNRTSAAFHGHRQTRPRHLLCIYGPGRAEHPAHHTN